MRDGKLGFAIVGCGVIGSFHSEAIAANDDATLVALCDMKEDSARKLASESSEATKAGELGIYSTCREMLEREDDIDCVCVCTPIRTGREPMVPGTEARKAADLILAVYESAHTGKEVEVPRH